jgi:aspartate aminotransferase
MSTDTIQHHLSDTIQRLSESATLAMARMARELKEEGKDVISLSLGEPDFNTPDFIKEAAKKAIDDNFSHYPPVNGYLEVREAISRKFKRDNKLNYSADQIVVSTGAKQSITNIVMAIVSAGEEVILPAPYWVSYSEMVKLANGVVVPIQTTIDTDFKITPEQLENAITPNTRMMIFSSPCNPSGSVYSEEELRGLAAVIKRYPSLYVISDEIYEHINFSGGHASLAAFEEVYDQVITVNGVSKAFAMTGWRIGYLGAPTWIAKACAKMQGQVTSAPCGIAQKATQAAVEADPSVIDEMRAAFLVRRDLVLNHLSKIPGLKTNIPEGAFYIFADVSSYMGKSDGKTTVNTPADLCMYLLENQMLALVSGEPFGDNRCIRISYAAADEVLVKACDRIAAGLNNLK